MKFVDNILDSEHCFALFCINCWCFWVSILIF